MPSTVGPGDPLASNCAATVMASPEVAAVLAALKEKDAPSRGKPKVHSATADRP